MLQRVARSGRRLAVRSIGEHRTAGGPGEQHGHAAELAIVDDLGQPESRLIVPIVEAMHEQQHVAVGADAPRDVGCELLAKRFVVELAAAHPNEIALGTVRTEARTLDNAWLMARRHADRGQGKPRRAVRIGLVGIGECTLAGRCDEDLDRASLALRAAGHQRTDARHAIRNGRDSGCASGHGHSDTPKREPSCRRPDPHRLHRVRSPFKKLQNTESAAAPRGAYGSANVVIVRRLGGGHRPQCSELDTALSPQQTNALRHRGKSVRHPNPADLDSIPVAQNGVERVGKSQPVGIGPSHRPRHKREQHALGTAKRAVVAFESDSKTKLRQGGAEDSFRAGLGEQGCAEALRKARVQPSFARHHDRDCRPRLGVTFRPPRSGRRAGRFRPRSGRMPGQGFSGAPDRLGWSSRRCRIRRRVRRHTCRTWPVWRVAARGALLRRSRTPSRQARRPDKETPRACRNSCCGGRTAFAPAPPAPGTRTCSSASERRIRAPRRSARPWRACSPPLPHEPAPRRGTRRRAPARRSESPRRSAHPLSTRGKACKAFTADLGKIAFSISPADATTDPLASQIAKAPR